ncbi:DEAD/DEAH box helicase [Streptomyces albireticuli]|uniref:Restriction endonuclease subunit R n=1 Tax=Streptomyces albireticuli TaxID=1940 RepID=A0A2A2DDA0_9ACTN|nr:DEAD/DEAH box helicase family protein [Streptomyces albireticuli]MCD9141461.1 DEAD/DEAH box helicase family protein [Streptomyces albireticuli]MCD9164288.1 DEAD/DEAH box helicase family protein [Streptomyces albireticuli]MCD9196393.1 DEAD/DEAH box helicase family protein [Streptomyces albireticuli]PAU49495.1 restriction endonuclease subunit R [Streptomyces albireticuli]
MSGFLDAGSLLDVGPLQFPRRIERLLWHLGFTDVSNIDGSGDQGGDILAQFRGETWVLQCKWKRSGAVGAEAVDEIARARDYYRAHRAVVVTNTRFSPEARRRVGDLARLGPGIMLWGSADLSTSFDRLPEGFGRITPRSYQAEALEAINTDLDATGRALLVLATGLGKTVVGGEVIAEHLRRAPKGKVLVVAHAKDLVQQLERALWRHLPKDVPTRLLTGDSRPDDLSGLTCATVGSALAAARFGYRPGFVLIDEAHHIGEDGQYDELLNVLRESRHLGVTATPWRGDSHDITHQLGEPSFSLGIEEGMRRGYLAQVDYRLFVDDVDWDTVRQASDHEYGLAELNAKLFLPQRDEAVRDELAAAWATTEKPRAIVFCRTIEHAERLADLLRRNPLWSGAAAIHAGLPKRERQNRLLAFRSGEVPILTSVDILNEGVDVPDVNILCFARVTHSRRIFVQQLGRGLRLREGKERVTVLDFVSDLRRIAAALNLKRSLDSDGEIETLPKVSPSKIVFSDQRVAALMDEWIKDAASLETAYDEHRLQFPSALAPQE